MTCLKDPKVSLTSHHALCKQDFRKNLTLWKNKSIWSRISSCPALGRNNRVQVVIIGCQVPYCKTFFMWQERCKAKNKAETLPYTANHGAKKSLSTCHETGEAVITRENCPLTFKRLGPIIKGYRYTNTPSSPYVFSPFMPSYMIQEEVHVWNLGRSLYSHDICMVSWYDTAPRSLAAKIKGISKILQYTKGLISWTNLI